MDNFIIGEFVVLGLIIFMLSIYPDRQIILEDEMGKVKDIQETMKEKMKNAKLQNKH